MNMFIPEFLMLAIYGVQNAYLPLFLRNVGFSATELGFLYSFFNISGIIVPLAFTPLIAKRNNFAASLCFFAVMLALIPFALFTGNFAFTALFLSLYAAFYKWLIPVSDSIITSTLGEAQEKYGMVRVAGSLGFVAMTLVMQHFCRIDGITKQSMILWLSVPAFVFGLSVALRSFILHLASARKASMMNASSSANSVSGGQKPLPAAGDVPESTLQILRFLGVDFYLMLFIMFIEFFAMVPSNQFLSLYVKESLHINASGVLWALGACAEVPLMFFSGRLIRRFGSEKILLFSTLVVTVRNLLYTLVPTIGGAVLGQLTHSITYGLFFPAGIMFCSKMSKLKPKATVIAMTLFSSVGGLAAVIGAAAGGVIIDNLGYRPLFLVFAAFPVIAVTAYLFVQKFRKK